MKGVLDAGYGVGGKVVMETGFGSGTHTQEKANVDQDGISENQAIFFF